MIRHPLGIPQYTLGHGERLAGIERRLDRLPGLLVAGNSYRGVSVNACVAEAPGIAERLLAHLEQAPGIAERLLAHLEQRRGP